MAECLIIPPIRTSRLYLEGIVESDVDGILQLYSDPLITQYLGVELMRTLDDAQRWLTYHRERQEKGLGILMAIRKQDSHEMIGTCSVEDINKHHHNATLGYSLAHAYWGQGLMHEMLLALVHYLFMEFSEVSLQRLQAWTQSENQASVRLLQRLGFLMEGCLRQLFFWHGTYKDLNCFSLLRDEYQQRLAQDDAVPPETTPHPA